MNLLDLMRTPPIRKRVDPDEPVLLTSPDEELILPHPRMAWDSARIQLHQQTDGLWMWATSFGTSQRGSGYAIGAKWGNFAETRDDALHWAIQELSGRLKPEIPEEKRICTWLQTLH